MPRKHALMPWLVRLALTTSMMSVSGFAYALGLGKLTLHSGLDELLSADIELTSDNPAEYSSLHVGLAPRSEFDTAGVDWMPLLSSIKYNVVKQPSGGYVLHLTSDQPMREPFLHFLLQADWTGGHLIREYTALLDPPYLVAAKPGVVEAPAVAPATTASETAPPAALAATTPPPASESAPVQPAAGLDKTAELPSAPAPPKEAVSASESSNQATAVAPAPEAANDANAAAATDNGVASTTQDDLLGPPSEVSASSESPPAELSGGQQPATPAAPAWANAQAYGPVKHGDTLWKIAEGVRGDKSVSVEQVMIALLKTNRGAFERTNVNNLKVGQILTMPDRAHVEEISAAEAAKQFRAQYDVWQAYNLRVASARHAVKVAANGDKPAAKGTIASAPAQVDKPTSTASASNTDLLRIVRDNLADASSAKNAAGTGKGRSAGVGEQKQLGDKVAVLEEAIASRELENKELRERVAQLEKQLTSTKRLVELENSQLALAQNQAKSAPPVAASKPTAQAAPAPNPVPKPASSVKPVPRPAVRPAIVAAKPADSSPLGFLQSLLDDPTTLAMMGGLVVIAGGVLALYYRRRRRSIAEFEESILSGGGLNSETPLDQSTPAAEASLLSEFSQGGMGNIHTDEVDPIAEAEVYLAYGRDEQAEAILKEAVVKDPHRHELRLKLLEIYHHRNDLRAFETLAEELYAALEGNGGKVWERVEEMGRKMNANNPLFRGGAPRAAPKSGGFEMTAPATVASANFAPVTPASPNHDTISFDLAAAAPVAPTSPATSEVTFDLDLGSAPAPSASNYSVDMPMSATSASSHDEALEFPDAGGFDLAEVSGTETTEAEPLALDTSDMGTIEFEATTDSGDMGITLEAPASSGAGEMEWNLETDAATTLAFEPEVTSGSEENFEDLVSSDEIATKLDLAKAYIDMGDADGARSILNEVAAEGNELQKKQAAELVAQIA